MVVKDVFMPEPQDITKVNQKKAISEMQQASEDIDVITHTMEKAGRVVGLPGLQQQMDEARKEADSAKAALEQTRQTGLENKITELSDKFGETSAADRASLKAAEARAEAAKEETTQLKFSVLNDAINSLKTMRADTTGTADIRKQLQIVKEVAADLGLGAPQAPPAMPPTMLLQMHKMDADLQIQLATMADESSRRDKEWQLTLRKWDEEKEMRHGEIQLKYQAEKERNGMLMGGLTKIGEMVAQSTVAAPQGVSERAPEGAEIKEKAPGPKVRDIQVAEGETGVFPCSDCGQNVAVADDAVNAVCANCNTVYRVHRKAAIIDEEAKLI